MALSESHFVCTEAEYRLNAAAGGSDQKANIQAALRDTTTYMERLIGRSIVSRGAVTEYHTIPFQSWRESIRLNQYPLLTLTSVHESCASPRVYDATTLLVNGTDYVYIADTGEIRRLCSSELTTWRWGYRAIKVVYTAGWAQADVPGELKRICLFAATSMLKESALQRWGVSAATDDQGNYQRFIGYLPPDQLQMLQSYALEKYGRTGEAA